MQIADVFLKQLDEQIQKKHLLKHEFYKAWSDGKLSLECLKEYAIEYYHHVKAFPTYLSALHAHTQDVKTRKKLLENLIEEEAGEPNHPDLWKAFAISLGATQEEMESHVPCMEIQNLIQAFCSICKERSTVEGLAALYAYESQIPSICISKIEGLKQHYGLKDPAAWRYFSVHITADEEHAQTQRELINVHISSKQYTDAQNAANQILDALWNFLSHMSHKYQIAC